MASSDENGLKSQLTRIDNIGSSVRSLSSYCFHGCTALQDVDLFCSNLSSVGECCFEGCTNIKNVKLPNSIATIGTKCFNNCSNLEKCIICSDFEYLGDYAFQNCQKLTSLSSFNSTVQSISNNSLKSSSIQTIYFKNVLSSSIAQGTTSFLYITGNNCFGVGHDCIIVTKDGVQFKYRYAANTLKPLGSEFSISFDKNYSESTGSMSQMFVDKGSKWTCPDFGYSSSIKVPYQYNTKSDGTGTSYTPGNSYDSPSQDMTLYVIWKNREQRDKKMAVLASYSQHSSQDSMNGVEANRLKTMLNDAFDNIEVLLQSTAQTILDKIKSCIENENCGYLFIYLFGHGNRETVSSKTSTYINFRNDTHLNGSKLWDILSEAECKVFVFIHTCHSGHFFKSAAFNPSISSDITQQYSIEDSPADFIGDAREYFNNRKLNGKQLFKTGATNTSSEPCLLLWSSNKASEYGWMCNSSDKTNFKKWWNAYGGIVGSGLGVSFYRNYNADKTYSEIWKLMNRSGEPATLNEYRIYGKGNDGGPTPLTDTYGGFDQSEKIFTI